MCPSTCLSAHALLHYYFGFQCNFGKRLGILSIAKILVKAVYLFCCYGNIHVCTIHCKRVAAGREMLASARTCCSTSYNLVQSRAFFSFVLFGATMEEAAGKLIHSTALRPITIWPSAHYSQGPDWYKNIIFIGYAKQSGQNS